MAFRVGMVMISASNDGSWGESGYKGLMDIQNLDGVEIALQERMPIDQLKSAFTKFAAAGFDLILGHGAELSEAILDVAKKFPETWFVCVNGQYTQSNLASFNFKEEQLGYLVGCLAARMSKRKKAGFITGLKIPTTLRQAWGFVQGVAASGAESLVDFTGSFDDIAEAYDKAIRQADWGVDVIYYYLKDGEDGVLSACKKRGKHAIGAIQDHYERAPDVLYASAIQNPGHLHLVATSLALAGKLEGRIYTFGLETPSAQGLGGLEHIPADLALEMMDIRNGIVRGKILVAPLS